MKRKNKRLTRPYVSNAPNGRELTCPNEVVRFQS